MPHEESGLISEGQVDHGSLAFHGRVEPGEGVDWIKTCEALHIGPVSEGMSLAGGGLVRAGPSWVLRSLTRRVGMVSSKV